MKAYFVEGVKVVKFIKQQEKKRVLQRVTEIWNANRLNALKGAL